MTLFWLSTERMTVGVEVDDSAIIRKTPPIARKFIGSRIGSLTQWLGKQGGLRWATLNLHGQRTPSSSTSRRDR